MLPMRTIAPPITDLSSRKVALTLVPGQLGDLLFQRGALLISQRASRDHFSIGDRQAPVHLQPVLFQNVAQRTKPLVPDQDCQEISHQGPHTLCAG